MLKNVEADLLWLGVEFLCLDPSVVDSILLTTGDANLHLKEQVYLGTSKPFNYDST